MELGGVRYAVDPDLKVRSGGTNGPARDCKDAARNLLDCLDVRRGGGQKVQVTKVSLDIEFEHGHGD